MTAELLSTTPLEQILKVCEMAEIRRLVVSEFDEEIVIRGRVSSWYYKQIAQEKLRGHAEGRKIINKVVVER